MSWLSKLVKGAGKAVGGLVKGVGKVAGTVAPLIGGSVFGVPLSTIATGLGALSDAKRASRAENAQMAAAENNQNWAGTLWKEGLPYRERLLSSIMSGDPMYGTLGRTASTLAGTTAGTGSPLEVPTSPWTPQQRNILLGGDLNDLAKVKEQKLGQLMGDMANRGLADSSIAGGATAAIEDVYNSDRARVNADLLREEIGRTDQLRGERYQRLGELLGMTGQRQNDLYRYGLGGVPTAIGANNSAAGIYSDVGNAAQGRLNSMADFLGELLAKKKAGLPSVATTTVPTGAGGWSGAGISSGNGVGTSVPTLTTIPLKRRYFGTRYLSPAVSKY